MTTGSLRILIKKSVDQVPPDRLPSLADFVAYLARKPLHDRIEKAERDLKKGRGTNWRTVPEGMFEVVLSPDAKVFYAKAAAVFSTNTPPEIR